MKNAKWRIFTLLPLVVLFLFLGGCLSTVQLPNDVKNTCFVTSSEISNWFESGVITKDGFVKPADGIAFSDVPNCDFYKWSEQMFLWLTSPAPSSYGGSGRVFSSPAFYDVSPLDANGERDFISHTPGLPHKFNLRATPFGPNKLPIVSEKKSGNLFEVFPTSFSDNGKQLILNEKREKVEVHQLLVDESKVSKFLDQNGRIIENPRPIVPKELEKQKIVQKFKVGEVIVFLTSSGSTIDVSPGQAGGGNVLMSQQGSLVFYQITVNDVFAYLKTGIENGAINTTQFPTTQSQLNDILNFAANNGKTLVDPEALAVEIKTSWVEASTIPSLRLDNFITINAVIPTYDESNPNEWIPIGQKTEKLAMVGMHVVGSTKGHKEMLWATFEHISVAPNSAYSYINTANQVNNVSQNTNGNWLFCANNSSGPFNQPHMFVNSNSEIESTGGFSVSASDTKRNNAWGSDNAQTPNPLVSSTAESNTDLISINNSVRNHLVNGDVRKNYIQTGTTWTIGGEAPTGPFSGAVSLGAEVGTSRLANTTMETYVQSTNCFACHSKSSDPTVGMLGVSAIWTELNPLF